MLPPVILSSDDPGRGRKGRQGRIEGRKRDEKGKGRGWDSSIKIIVVIIIGPETGPQWLRTLFLLLLGFLLLDFQSTKTLSFHI